ncbi:type II secretion system F family protein [Citricoccus sp. I39-566]|uniref:type II secretion system F family protein n=1 Tax=Citricoccus sp. I39-566 TaxID=3073268 RepID=UPI00286C8D73|nr:type II secretion system F family protein [Citricoccus sp. I39-566]WMY78304.1 type II secretion system F family protein [Citricoccus sp. I39-566]
MTPSPPDRPERRGHPGRDAEHAEHAEDADETESTLDAAVALDLLAGLLDSGQSLVSGLDLLGTHLPGAGPVRRVALLLRVGVEWDEAWTAHEPEASDPDLQELAGELRFAHVTGAPTAALLRSTAASLRRHRKRRAEQRAAELGTRLVLPLGLCQLPSFICLGVVPLVLALLP